MPVPVQINGSLQTYSVENGEISIALKAGDHVVIDPNMKVFRYLPIIDKCKTEQ